MGTRQAGASAVIVHRIPAEAVEWFADWQRGILTAAAAFPGHLGVDHYPPGPGNPGEWVTVLHFADPAALDVWLRSPERAVWVRRFQERYGEFELMSMPAGLGAWFADRGRTPVRPPGWKTALTVLLALYPTVMLLTILVYPITNHLGMAVAILIGNALSVMLLQWLVMPWLTRAARPWLAARGPGAWRVGAVGAVLALTALAVMAALFRLVTG